MKIDLNTILIIGLAVFVLFFNKPKVVYNKTIKEIETRVEEKTYYKDSLIKEVKYLKPVLDTLYLKRYNTIDTVKIKQIQDTIIVKQKEVITKQDTVINVQEDLILSKDTIIDLERSKNKKKAKTIVKLVGAQIITTALLILRR